jgi:hypothetical protein
MGISHKAPAPKFAGVSVLTAELRNCTNILVSRLKYNCCAIVLSPYELEKSGRERLFVPVFS